MNVVQEINRINAVEAVAGVKGGASWHDQYSDSAYIFFGGMPFELTEGDLICLFSQYGEPADINLIRNESSGTSKGFGFIAYEDQRSTNLAVDNLNGIKILGRSIRVDHCADYKHKTKKDDDEIDEKDVIPESFKDVIGESPLERQVRLDAFKQKIEEKKAHQQEKEERKMNRDRIRAERELRRATKRKSKKGDKNRDGSHSDGNNESFGDSKDKDDGTCTIDSSRIYKQEYRDRDDDDRRRRRSPNRRDTYNRRGSRSRSRHRDDRGRHRQHVDDDYDMRNHRRNIDHRRSRSPRH